MAGLNRRDLMMAGAGLALGPRAEATAARSAGRPNILFILADDLGYADLSCYGRPDYRTPVLDGLARDGLMMTSAYANSAVCSASRTALITGRYQYRLKVGLFEPGGGGADYGIPDGHPTLPSLLQRQGYRTSLFGKWHLGSPPKYSPIHRGYDYFFGFMGGASDYFRAGGRGTPRGTTPCTTEDPGAAGRPPAASRTATSAVDGGGDAMSDGLHENDTPVVVPGYLTDLLADHAVREIQSCAKAGKPFFLSLHFNAPHWPWEGPGDEEASKSITGLKDDDRGSLRKYAEMVRAMDSAIGRVLEQVRRSGIERDTLVIFTSDNGGERFSDDWPFIGNKGELLEGGLRIPLILRWPRQLRAGGRSDQLLMHMDWLPTLLAAADGAPDPAYPSDGLNVLPVLLGDRASAGRTLFWRYKAAEQAAMRENEWKYLRLGGQEFLFNIAADERERANRRAKEPERFERMKQQWAEWNASMLPYPEGMNSDNPKANCWADRY
jgi:arylsulfatase A-like enzyme